MGLLIRLVFTAVAGLFTFITKKVPWLAIVSALATLFGLLLTIIQLYLIARDFGWIS